MKQIVWITLLVFLFAGVAVAGPIERFFKDKDADQLINLDESDVAVIELESQPSTGHGWQVDETTGEHVRIIARRFESSQSGLLGSPGIERIYVVGQTKGESDLKFEYRRPFEKKKAALRSLKFRFKARAKFRESFRSAYEAWAVNRAAAESDQGGGDEAQITYSATSGVPSSYNWCDTHGGCTPVKNQGQCGACWAFATQGVLENLIKAEDNITVDLSEQYLISCNKEGWGCFGGFWAHDYNLNKKVSGETEAGAPLESTMPYRAWDTYCNPPHEKAYQITSWGYVCGSLNCTPTTEQIKQAILDHGPLATGIYADYYMQSYRSGVFTGSPWGSRQPNHAVIIVGWDDSQSCWIIRNQWSSEWGENGYMRIRYGVAQVGSTASYVDYQGNGGSEPTIPSSGSGCDTAEGGSSGCE